MSARLCTVRVSDEDVTAIQNCKMNVKCMRACVRIYRFSNIHSTISRIGFTVPTGARAIGSAETIEKWVNRSNVLPAALRLSQRSRFLFSRVQRLFRWNSKILLTRFSISFFSFLLSRVYSSLYSPFIFNRSDDLESKLNFSPQYIHLEYLICNSEFDLNRIDDCVKCRNYG